MDTNTSRQKIVLAEQRFSDPILGAEILVKMIPGSTEPYRIQIRFSGSDEVRELRFDEDGMKSGSSTTKATSPDASSKLRLIK
jgi:hypothetical protein